MNILIGSNGGLTGIYLAKKYKEMESVFIIGADSSADSTGRFFVDKQVIMPPANDKMFVDELIKILNENEIDVYLPTHSKEIRIVSLYSDRIQSETSAKFLVSPIKTFNDLENKSVANRNLSDAGIPVPKRIDDFESGYPIIMKKNIGSGSSGTIIIDNPQIHKAYLSSVENVDFYELIIGKEYTLDCMFGAYGELIGFNQRQRVKTIGGAVSITKNYVGFDIAPWIHKIASKWKFCGCVNFQYIVRDNIPYFIDVNLRYPSGGLPLTVESGLNVPQLIISILNNEPVESFVLPDQNKELTMYRYFEEIFC